jgi:hypothetical protein
MNTKTESHCPLLRINARARKWQDTCYFSRHIYAETLVEVLALAEQNHRNVLSNKRNKNCNIYASDQRIYARVLMDKANALMKDTLSKGEHFDFNTFNAITLRCLKTLKLKT